MTSTAALLADADLCVKCGLCLPHCPTYRVEQNEADGPRGRIALIQGLANGQLTATAKLHAHLDGCLSCRACEAVCPAQVPYGRILDGGRTRLATPSRTRLTRAMAWVLLHKPARALVRWGLWLLGLAFGAPKAMPSSASGLRRWLAYRPSASRLRRMPATTRGKVALFSGCVGDIVEREVLADALALLQALGVDVCVPPAQSCCGALHQHGGLPGRAAQLAQANSLAFADCDTVLALASGCGAALHDLGIVSLRPKLRDLCGYLAEQLEARPLPLMASTRRVAIHVPCTQANVLHAADATRRLLMVIPGIELLTLAPESGCCGAAGTAFLTQPAMADRLLAPKLDAAAQSQPDVIVSANIGCALHLAVGLRQRGLSAPVLHPVSLLAQAWRAGQLAPSPVPSTAR